ncbi:hypothetical protein JCM6294_3591 [Bacteroides pyogenes DSM 20611 = JCM 6294]|uniref:Uncharacterized protein n=1 Tax=Bacteroides pyogenes DSM 20611 = JCM 6294 TaxID=1121100 RepID=W4PMP4_9BACE|nr:hypothetical protein JCM6294_3591 [Bacteroides pyogenes DSM 20611 = JCM 6294]
MRRFVVMLKVPEWIEVKTNQYGDDFSIRHHALSLAFGCIESGWKCIFSHLWFKFFAKIVCNTKKINNFTSGNHGIS